MTFPGLDISRGLGYALGFFAFWAATASSSLFTWILLRPSPAVSTGVEERLSVAILAPLTGRPRGMN